MDHYTIAGEPSRDFREGMKNSRDLQRRIDGIREDASRHLAAEGCVRLGGIAVVGTEMEQPQRRYLGERFHQKDGGDSGKGERGGDASSAALHLGRFGFCASPALGSGGGCQRQGRESSRRMKRHE